MQKDVLKIFKNSFQPVEVLFRVCLWMPVGLLRCVTVALRVGLRVALSLAAQDWLLVNE